MKSKFLKFGAVLLGFGSFISAPRAADVPESVGEFSVGCYSVKRAVFDNIGSTQTITNQALDDLASGNTQKFLSLFRQDRLFENQVLLVTARSQTAGIGQHGRKWESPVGNVYATFVFPFPEATQLFYLPQITNLAVCETVEMFGFSPKFKWINDTLLDGKKCSGTLCTSKGIFDYRGSDGNVKKYNAFVAGIGLNVNMDLQTAQERFESIDDSMKVPFTSMRISSGRSFDVENTLTCLTHNLVRLYGNFVSEKSFDSFFPRINKRLAYINSNIMYEESKEVQPVQAVLSGINVDGMAVLKFQDGTQKTVLTGRIRPIE